jgi:hypothetical protein
MRSPSKRTQVTLTLNLSKRWIKGHVRVKCRGRISTIRNPTESPNIGRVWSYYRPTITVVMQGWDPIVDICQSPGVTS